VPTLLPVEGQPGPGAFQVRARRRGRGRIGVIYMLYRAFSADPYSKLAALTSIRAIAAFLTAFLIVWMLAPRVIAGLYRRGLRDRPRDYLDAWAFSKSGTPTMGGVLIVLGMLSASLIWGDLSSPPIPLLL